MIDDWTDEEVEAEVKLLGSLIRNPHDIPASVSGPLFRDPLHQKIYYAIRICIRRGVTPDPVNIAAMLSADEEWLVEPMRLLTEMVSTWCDPTAEVEILKAGRNRRG